MAEEVQAILNYLELHETSNSVDIAKALDLDHLKVVGAIKSIQCSTDVIECKQVQVPQLLLTAEGKQVAEQGSHEFNLFRAVDPQGTPQADLMSSVANAKIGFSKAIAAKWIRVDKSGGAPRVFRNMDSVEDVLQACLQKINDLKLDDIAPQQIQDLKKRKLVNEGKMTSYNVSKGSRFTTSLQKEETDLTPEMIATGSWRNLTFKPYCFSAQGKIPHCGHLHPLLKVRAEFRAIFLEMGFTEMPTNNFVEASFWNFDALFQPQQHPARDAHDTFFLSDPAVTLASKLPAEYVERVRKVHSIGGFGSQGYRYDWALEEAAKNLLRTHTTAVSARMLYRLAQEKEFRPVKYFSIDRVFRNESLDATHLAEFHQIEGVVADRGLHLGHLMGILHEFFRKLGISKLRFKPAYNPYTEPSMEVFSYHEGLKKWVEVGNSGIFRPEMLLPMGLPPDVSVIAWGLSLERPTMIKYGISNIRDLIGPKVKLRMVYDSPICRLEK